MCSEGGLPSEMQDLELAIHHHQTLYEQVTQAYTEVRPRPTTDPTLTKHGPNTNTSPRGMTHEPDTVLTRQLLLEPTHSHPIAAGRPNPY